MMEVRQYREFYHTNLIEGSHIESQIKFLKNK